MIYLLDFNEFSRLLATGVDTLISVMSTYEWELEVYLPPLSSLGERLVMNCLPKCCGPDPSKASFDCSGTYL